MLTRRNILNEILDTFPGVWESVMDSRVRYVFREDNTFSLVHATDRNEEGRSEEGTYSIRDNRLHLYYSADQSNTAAEFVFSVHRNRLTLKAVTSPDKGGGPIRDFIRIG
ncbi:MAG: DUF5640 domain-containing protein [Candidatus Latescibacterota bacterium]